MFGSLEKEIRRLTEEMVKNLSGITLFNEKNKEKFQDFLSELKEEGEIIQFLPKPQDPRFKDFVVIVEKKGKYDAVGIAIKDKEEEIESYMKRQDQLREQISKYRKFVERFVFAVNSRITNEDLKQQWTKALRQYKES